MKGKVRKSPFPALFLFLSFPFAILCLFLFIFFFLSRYFSLFLLFLFSFFFPGPFLSLCFSFLFLSLSCPFVFFFFFLLFPLRSIVWLQAPGASRSNNRQHREGEGNKKKGNEQFLKKETKGRERERKDRFL